MKYIKNYNIKTNEEFLNEGLRDDMVAKDEEEIRKIFKEKYDIDYLDFEVVLAELKEHGVNCKLVANPYKPIEINGWSITRRNNNGNGWGIGTAITEKIALKIASTLKENLGEFWDESQDNFVVEKENFTTFNVDHKEALIILSKIRKM